MTKILIVDDEPEIIMIAKWMLERDGHEIDEAENGEDCLNKVKKEKYDLILLDVMMPKGINGWEVCKKIKADKNTKDTQVVLFTVRTDAGDLVKGKEAGADAQVNKPFDKEELIDAVKKALKGT